MGMQQEISKLRKEGIRNLEAARVSTPPEGELERQLANLQQQAHVKPAEMRDLVANREERLVNAIEDDMRSEKWIAYEDFPRERFKVSAGVGEGLGYVELVIQYSGIPSEGLFRNIVQKLRRKRKPRTVSFTASLQMQGPDKDLPTLKLKLPNHWGADAHNTFEKAVATYVHDAVEHARAAHLKAHEESKKIGLPGSTISLSYIRLFESQLIADLSRAMKNPSFLGAYRREVIQTDLKNLRQKYDAGLAEVYKGLVQDLEELRSGCSHLKKRLSERLANVDSDALTHLEQRNAEINASAEKTLERLSAYEESKRTELEERLLKEVRAAEQASRNRLSTIEAEIRVYEEAFKKKRGRIEDSRIYMLEQLRDLFPDFYENNSRTQINEAYRAKAAQATVDFIYGRGITVSPEQFVNLIRTIKLHSYEGTLNGRRYADTILACGRTITSKANPEKIEQIRKAIRDSCAKGKLEIPVIEEMTSTLL